jgi:hypothetical protein
MSAAVATGDQPPAPPGKQTFAALAFSDNPKVNPETGLSTTVVLLQEIPADKDAAAWWLEIRTRFDPSCTHEVANAPRNDLSVLPQLPESTLPSSVSAESVISTATCGGGGIETRRVKGSKGSKSQVMCSGDSVTLSQSVEWGHVVQVEIARTGPSNLSSAAQVTSPATDMCGTSSPAPSTATDLSSSASTANKAPVATATVICVLSDTPLPRHICGAVTLMVRAGLSVWPKCLHMDVSRLHQSSPQSHELCQVCLRGLDR